MGYDQYGAEVNSIPVVGVEMILSVDWWLLMSCKIAQCGTEGCTNAAPYANKLLDDRLAPWLHTALLTRHLSSDL
jgi:hypothetical protein